MATLPSLSPGALLPGGPLRQAARVGGRIGRSAGRMAVAPARSAGSMVLAPARSAGRALSAPASAALLAGLDEALSALDTALRSPLAEEALGRIGASQLAGDVRERLLAPVLDSPEAERLVDQVIESRVVDAAMLKLLDTDALWELVDVIAGSPAVTAAISQQGLGFANQMAGAMRDRSRTADDRLEGLARRLTRRSDRDKSAAGDSPEPGQ